MLKTVEIPSGVECVVVRGHDQTHGYGRVAAVVSVATGAVRRTDQGAEPNAFGPNDCP